MTNFLLVDDHPIILQSVSRLLESDGRFSVLKKEESFEKALSFFREYHPLFVILDLDIKGKNGMDLLEEMRRVCRVSPILIFSMVTNIQYIERALRLGANGFCFKSDPPESFLKAVHQVINNQLALPEKVSQVLLSSLIRGNNESMVRGVDLLSSRELEVLYLVGDGQTTKEIAEDLKISKKTVDSYKEKIKEKLEVKNSNKLIHLATKLNLQSKQAKSLTPACFH